MKIGIIGPGQSGKTTIFKILLQGDSSGNIGVFKFSDHRIDKLSQIYSAKKTTYPEFTFIDMGSMSGIEVKDYSKFQDIDLFICVIGAFFSDDPRKDLESYFTDLILSDMQAIQNRFERIEKDRIKFGKDISEEEALLKKCQGILDASKFLYRAGLSAEELKLFSGFSFITLKPLIAAINVPESFDEGKIKAVEEYSSSLGVSSVRFFGKTELEVLELEQSERENFLKEMNIGDSLRENISRLITRELNLITFFTAGEKDTRGWHLEKGLPVIEAAGKIHSDIKRGFIRAEIVNYEDFIKYEGNMQKVKEQALLRVEGKEYIVKDGDMLNIRFNV